MASTNNQTFKQAVLAAINATYEQGTASIRSQGSPSCAYRGYNGSKCVVGHLINDDYYRDELEGESVEDIGVLDAVENSMGMVLNDEQVKVLGLLQAAHDIANRLGDFRQNFTDLIQEYVQDGRLPRWALE